MATRAKSSAKLRQACVVAALVVSLSACDRPAYVKRLAEESSGPSALADASPGSQPCGAVQQALDDAETRSQGLLSFSDNGTIAMPANVFRMLPSTARAGLAGIAQRAAACAGNASAGSPVRFLDIDSGDLLAQVSPSDNG